MMDGNERVFLSYHRRGDEAELADRLKGYLTGLGYSVFIDTGMQIGIDWAKEIRRQIDKCSVFIVLLSEQSIAREMVQTEIRQAVRRRRRSASPILLPIRVQYDGPLDYEVESYLGRYHHARWIDRDDDARLFEQIRTAIIAGVVDSNSVPDE